MSYFTDRELGLPPRTNDAIGDRVWGGIYALISVRQVDNSIGFRFPEQCPDGNGPCGYDYHLFTLTAAAEIPALEWPLSASTVPDTPVIMDLLEFIAASVGEPEQGTWHSYFNHHHLSWDRNVGLERFVAEVNRLFARNGIAFELTAAGQAVRLLPEPLRDALAGATFNTGDLETDRLLERAGKLIVATDLNTRRDALEKIWDAFERIKTLEAGADKRQQANALLDRVAGLQTPMMRTMLGDEAKALTDIGNRFRIRHSETAQEIPAGSDQVDYLFHRMYAFVRLLLKSTGRGG